MGSGIPPVRRSPVRSGRHWDGEWLDGVRPPFLIETLEDLAHAIRGRRDIDVTCAYCGQVARIEGFDSAYRWWVRHEDESYPRENREAA